MATSVRITVNMAQRRDLATQLLAAAEKLGLPPGVVRSLTDGYEVPIEVADAAGVVLPGSGGDVEHDAEAAPAKPKAPPKRATK